LQQFKQAFTSHFSTPLILKIFQWIFRIVLAAVLSLGVAAFIMHRDPNVDFNHLTSFQYWIVFLTVPSVAFGLFVFLSCLFVQANKRRAGVIAVLLSIIFIGFGTYQHYMDNGYLPNQYIIRYSCFLAGLALGYLLSYKMFKNNNWYYFA
jgi:ABC-type phosphate transport system permease subunit